eukprot:Skav216476  [mRNA]  locus=scaffold1123:253381:260736:- [translate_table: standard]
MTRSIVKPIKFQKKPTWTEPVTLALKLLTTPCVRQGQCGFRAYARRALERFRQSGEEEEALKCSDTFPLQRYQLRVAFLLHPQSPLSRLLVVHATGSGKTRTVLAAAQSFYRSGKATCLFFPEEAVKENFYQEILKFPGAWRDFFCATAVGARRKWPNSTFRFGFDGKNPMSNKNLVFDEVHNMLALPRRAA